MQDRTGKPLNIGNKVYSIDIPEKDIKCIPFNIIDTGIKALHTQNIHIIMFFIRSSFYRSLITIFYN